MSKISIRSAVFALATTAATFGAAGSALAQDTTVAADPAAAPETTAAPADTVAAPAGGVAAGGGFLADESGSSTMPVVLAFGAVGAAGAVYVARRRRA